MRILPLICSYELHNDIQVFCNFTRIIQFKYILCSISSEMIALTWYLSSFTREVFSNNKEHIVETNITHKVKTRIEHTNNEKE